MSLRSSLIGIREKLSILCHLDSGQGMCQLVVDCFQCFSKMLKPAIFITIGCLRKLKIFGWSLIITYDNAFCGDLNIRNIFSENIFIRE